MADIDQRVALVTGATRGIGAAFARELGARGYGLTVVGRNEQRTASLAAELRARDVTVHAVVADLSDSDCVVDAFRQHREVFGRLDVLVNNAGLGIARPVDELTDKHISLQIDLNLRAVVLAYREAADMLRSAARERGSALVVNMSSLTAHTPEPMQALYAATKAAIISLTKGMNVDLGPDGVKSTALCPGYVDTDMTEFLRERVPAEQMLRTADIVGALRWLLETSSACVVPEIPFARPGGVV